VTATNTRFIIWQCNQNHKSRTSKLNIFTLVNFQTDSIVALLRAYLSKMTCTITKLDIMTHQNGIMTIMTSSKMSYDNDTCIAQSNNIQNTNTDQNDAHQNDTNSNNNKHNNPV
jgi:hypothetical protein